MTLKNKMKKAFFVLLLVLIIFLIIVFLQKPSLDRDWALDHQVLSEVFFSGNIVDAKNIRNFKYSSESDYEMRYYDRKYNLSKIESVYYIIEPFSEYDGPAHTMLSFGFYDGNFLVISAEIRKVRKL